MSKRALQKKPTSLQTQKHHIETKIKTKYSQWDKNFPQISEVKHPQVEKKINAQD